MAADRKIVFTFEGDTKDLESALRTLTRATKKSGDEMEGVSKSAKKAGTSAAKAGDKGAKSFKEFEKRLEKVKGRIKKVVGTLAVMAAALAYAVKKQIDLADETGKTAEALGVTSESLSALAHQAKFAGVSQEQLVTALRGLGKTMVDSVRNPTSEVAQIFSDLGINVEASTGKLKKTDVVLAELADAFKGMVDGPEKAAIAMRLMEEAGMRMIPMLNGGSSAMRAARDEAKALGRIWSEDATKNAAEFNDAVEELKATLGGVFRSMSNDWIPTLIDLVAGIDLAVRSFFGLGDAARAAFSDTIKGEIAGVSVQISTTEDRVFDLIEKIEELTPKKGLTIGPRGQAELDMLTESLERATANLATQRTALLAFRKDLRGAADAAGDLDDATPLKVVTAEQATAIEALEGQISAMSLSFLEGQAAIDARASARTKLIIDWAIATDTVAAYAKVAALLGEVGRQREKEEAAEAAARRERWKQEQAREETRVKSITSHVEETRKAFEDSWVSRLEGVNKVDAAEQVAMDRARERTQEIIDEKAKTDEEILALEESLQMELEQIRLEHGEQRKKAIKEEMDLRKVAADKEKDRAREAHDASIKMANDIAGTFADVAGSIASALDDVTSKLVGIASESRQKVEQLSADLRTATTEQERERLGAELATASRALRDQKAAAMEAFGVGKAAAVSQASIAGALAVVNAMATPGAPWPVAAGFAIAAGVAAAVSIGSIAAEPPPTFHSGGMVGLGAPDEISARLLRSEAVLSPQGVRAAGGPGGVRDLNQGGTAGHQPVITVFKVRSRAVDAMMSDNLRTKQGPLVDALRAAQPRALGRHNPYSSG